MSKLYRKSRKLAILIMELLLSVSMIANCISMSVFAEELPDVENMANADGSDNNEDNDEDSDIKDDTDSADSKDIDDDSDNEDDDDKGDDLNEDESGNEDEVEKSEKEDEGKEAEESPFVENFSVDGVDIEVTADADVFPEGAYVEVNRVYDDSMVEAFREYAVTNSEDGVEEVVVFDITAYNADGNEIQPNCENGSVSVRFNNVYAKDSEEIKVLHADDAENLDDIEQLDASIDDEGVEVNADHFSPFAVIKTAKSEGAVDYSIVATADGKLHKNTSTGEEITLATGSLTLANGVWTMENVDFATSAKRAIAFKDDAKVNLVGDNTLVSTYDGAETSMGLCGGSNLEIYGSGSLTAIAGNSSVNDSFGIYAKSKLTISGGTIKAAAGDISGGKGMFSNALFSNNKLTITGGELTLEGGNINNGTENYVFGICSLKGDVSISSANVNITTGNVVSGKAGNIFGVYGSNVEVKNGASVNATLGDILYSEIITENGSTKVYRESIIWAYNNISINNASVNGKTGNIYMDDTNFGECNGFSAVKETHISNNSNIELQVGSEGRCHGIVCNGIDAQSSNINIKVAGGYDNRGMCSYNPLTINNCSLTIRLGDTSHSSYGIEAISNLTITDSILDILAGRATAPYSMGIKAYYEEKVTISGSQLNVGSANDIVDNVANETTGSVDDSTTSSTVDSSSDSVKEAAVGSTNNECISNNINDIEKKAAVANSVKETTEVVAAPVERTSVSESVEEDTVADKYISNDVMNSSEVNSGTSFKSYDPSINMDSDDLKNADEEASYIAYIIGTVSVLAIAAYAGLIIIKKNGTLLAGWSALRKR